MPENLNIPELFHSGDYATVAMAGRPDRWQTYAALGLLGKAPDALDGIARFDGEEPRFYEAVTYWIDGDDEAAKGILNHLALPHAKNLLRLIQKDRIHVLAQLPWYRQPPHNLLDAAAKDRKFRVRNISFHQLDLPNAAGADAHRYYAPDDPPDFYISSFVEMQLMPPNLPELPCPLFGVTADYDVHIQAVYPWLRIFDEMIVAARKEWNEVRQLTGTAVSTFPKLYGLPEDLPPVPEGDRRIDFFLSGTLKHPYHPDKAKLLHQALRMEGINMRTIQGFLPPRSYNRLMGHSKAGFAYVRHPDGMVTRALEALSMGCAVAVQRGSILTLYASEEEGVLTYDLDAGDFPDAIRRICRNWDEFGPRARRGAEVVRREFGESRVASQFLRYLTFLAAKPRKRRRPTHTANLPQKRLIIWKGPQIAPRAQYEAIRDRAIARGRERMKRSPDARTLIDMARELVMEYAASERDDELAPASDQLLEMIFKLYRAGLKHMPRSLVLRFNLARVGFHYGSPDQVSEALELAEDALARPVSHWQIDPMEDVFSWDFFSSYFNYRDYFDLLTRRLMDKKPLGRAAASLILASLHAYVAHYRRDAAHYTRAVSLDPAFPFYKLRRARALIERGEPGDDDAAGELLVELAENSMLITEAVEFLEQLYASGRFRTDSFEQLVELAQRDKQGSVFEGAGDEKLKPLESARPTENAGPRLSVIAYIPRDARRPGAFLNHLATQTAAPIMEVVAACAPGATAEKALVEEFRRYQGNLTIVPTREGESECDAVNRCIEAARSPLLTLLKPGDVLSKDALESLMRALDEAPNASLVYADCNMARLKIPDADEAVVEGGTGVPDFNRRLLFQTCFIGPWVMWRRELHERYGLFDPASGAAWDYEFWLRIAPTETFVPLHRMLGHRLRWCDEPLQEIRDQADCEKARARNWPPSWGARPGPVEDFFFPTSIIFSVGKLESKLLGCLRILTPADYRDAIETLPIIRSAVLKHDWLMAETAIRSLLAVVPQLVGIRLILSDAVRKQGRSDEADDILREALAINPFESPLRLRMAGKPGPLAAVGKE